MLSWGVTLILDPEGNHELRLADLGKSNANGYTSLLSTRRAVGETARTVFGWAQAL
jgi:hypothetical protein